MKLKEIIYSVKNHPEDWILYEGGVYLLVHKSGWEIWLGNSLFFLFSRADGELSKRHYSLFGKIRLYFALKKHFISWMNIFLIWSPSTFIFKNDVEIHNWASRREFLQNGFAWSKDNMMEAMLELMDCMDPALALTSQNKMIRHLAKEKLEDKDGSF